MVLVHFYEKPGCVSNARQKQALSKAGHLLVVHDLLQQRWAEDRAKLRTFFGDKPVSEWFNQSAPALKDGTINPESLDEEQAIELMLANPILIRRPLLEIGERRFCGFDLDEIGSYLNIRNETRAVSEQCPKKPGEQSCSP